MDNQDERVFWCQWRHFEGSGFLGGWEGCHLNAKGIAETFVYPSIGAVWVNGKVYELMSPFKGQFSYYWKSWNFPRPQTTEESREQFLREEYEKEHPEEYEPSREGIDEF